MKNKELNLCKILKGNEGTKIYCTLFGYGTIVEILDNGLVVQDKFGTIFPFYSDGRFSDEDGDYDEGECLLFPSKDNRDWNTWKNPKPKVKRLDPKLFKPFDRVLVKNSDKESQWCIDFFGCFTTEIIGYSVCCGGTYWAYCIPYNDDTKHLVGTTDEAPEYYKYWED